MFATQSFVVLLPRKLSFLLIGSFSLYNFFYNIRFWNFSENICDKKINSFILLAELKMSKKKYATKQSLQSSSNMILYMVFFLIICRQPLKFTSFQRASLILGSVALSRSVASDVPFTVCSLSFPYLTIMLLGEELCHLKGTSNTGSEV